MLSFYFQSVQWIKKFSFGTSSLTCGFFMLLNFQALEILLLSFCHWFLAGSHCIQRTNTLHMISVLLNVLRFVLWPRIWSVVNATNSFDSKMCVLGAASVLCMSVRPCSSIARLSLSVFSLWAYQLLGSMGVKPPVSDHFPFSSVHFCLVDFGAYTF